MKRLRLILLSLGLAFVIILVPVLFIIIPANEKQIFLNKEEKIVIAAEKKSEAISNAISENTSNSESLNEKLQEKTILPFIEEALNASQLSIDSVKPNQGNEHDEVHLILKGDYYALLNFISLLSQQPNASELISFSIEKNRIEIIFKDNDKQIVFEKTKHHSTFLKRLSTALMVIKIPVFVPRVLLEKNEGPFQSLENLEWHLSGEVRKQNVLLGVFLAANNQSRYFGIDLPWENSDWQVINIAQNRVVFENLKNNSRWSLPYRSVL